VLALGTETVVCHERTRQPVFFCGGVESTAELLRTLGRSAGLRETRQNPASDISLFDSAVILLDSPVEVRVAAMRDLRAKYFPDRTWIRIVAVGGDLFRSFVDTGEGATKKHWAATMFRVALSIESTRLPSRSMARYK
jgi:hypothetical protein